MVGAAPTPAARCLSTPPSRKSRFGLLAALAVVLAVAAWPASAQPRFGAAPRGASVPKLWSVEIDAHAAPLLSAAYRNRMRRAGINALVVDPTGVNARQLAAAARAARLAKLSLIEVVPPARAAKTKSVKSVRATCREASRPAGTMCAVRAPSVAAALKLAAGGRPDQLVVVRLDGPKAFTRLRAASAAGARIVALPKLTAQGGFARGSWQSAIALSATAPMADLGVSPRGRKGRRALASYLTLLSQGIVSTAGKPSPPGGLVTTASTRNSVSLSWAAPSGSSVAGYTVYVGSQQAGTTVGTSYTASGLACGTSYAVAVDAYDAAGDHSDKASVSAGTAPCSDTSPPTTPGSLIVSGSTSNSISVSWHASADDVGVAGYTIYVNSTQVGTTAATSYAAAGLACGTSYTVAVDAYDAAGNHSDRTAVQRSTGACSGDTTPPSTPGSLTQTGSTTSSVALSWSASSDNVAVSGYTVYVNSTQVGTTAATAYTASGLTCGSSYTVAVDAYDAAGNHSARTSQSAQTAACGGGSATANIWLAASGSDSGSNCTRSASPVLQPSPATACATLAKAYSLASCGDTIDIVSGTFGPDQFIKQKAALDSCTSPVVIQSATGNRADVVFGRILSESNYGTYSGAASWFTLQHVTVLDRFEATQPGHNFTLNDIDGGTFDLNGVQHVVIENSDWGPCNSDNTDSSSYCHDPAKIQSGGGGGLTEDVLLYRNNIHDWTFTQNHLTCLAPWGGNDITIDSNHIWNCDVFGIEVSSVGSGNCATDPSWDHLVIQNNWFGRINQETPINTNAVVFTHGGVWTNTLIRYNSFAGISAIATTSSPPCEVAGVTAIGNVGAFENCVPGMTYKYNVWAGSGTCGTGDVDAPGLPYANTSDQAPADYHLSGAAGSTLADNRVPCASGAGLLALDRDGNARPGVPGQSCDAGAQER
jgi:chitodextrinase